MRLTVFCEVITSQAQVQTSAMKFFKGLEYLLLNKQSIHKQLYSFFFFPLLPVLFLFMSHGCFCTLLFIFCCHIVLFVSELLPCLTFCLPSSSCAMNNCYSMPWGFPSPICLKSLACCYLHWVTSIARKRGQVLILQFSLKRKSKRFAFTSLSSLCVSLVPCSTYHWNGLPVSLILHLNLKSCLRKEREISPSSYGILLSGAVKHLWWDLCLRGWLITTLQWNKSFNANICSWFCFPLPSLEFGMVSLIFSAALAYFPSRPPFPPSVAAASQRLSYRRSFCRLLR